MVGAMNIQNFRATSKNRPIEYGGYPFGPITLSILVESDDYSLDELIINPEDESSGLSESIEVSGYRPKDLIAKRLAREYSTNWGFWDGVLATNRGGYSNVERHSVAEFTFEFTRSAWIGIGRQLVPVFVVIAVAILSFYLPAQLAGRVSIPPGLLLALVFIQGRQYGDIPASADGWTYIGKLIACGYLIVFLSFVDAIRAQQLNGESEIQAFESASRKKGVLLLATVFFVSLL